MNLYKKKSCLLRHVHVCDHVCSAVLHVTCMTAVQQKTWAHTCTCMLTCMVHENITVKDCAACVAHFTKYMYVVKMVELNTSRPIRTYMYMVFIKLMCMYQVQKTFTRIIMHLSTIHTSTHIITRSNGSLKIQFAEEFKLTWVTGTRLDCHLRGNQFVITFE